MTTFLIVVHWLVGFLIFAVVKLEVEFEHCARDVAKPEKAEERKNRRGTATPVPPTWGRPEHALFCSDHLLQRNFDSKISSAGLLQPQTRWHAYDKLMENWWYPKRPTRRPGSHDGLSPAIRFVDCSIAHRNITDRQNYNVESIQYVR